MPANERSRDPVEVWGGGVTAGIAGGVVMGLVMHFGADLVELLGGLAPIPGTAASVGWTIHMIISILFGLLFAVIVSRPVVRTSLETFSAYLIAGLAFGAALGILAGGLIFPVAMVRAEVATLPLPFLPVPGLAGELLAASIFAIGHLLYGLVVGGVFAIINGVFPQGLPIGLPAPE